MSTKPVDPILEAARKVETIRFEYEKAVNTPQPADLEERIKVRAAVARLGLELNKADTEFYQVVEAERQKG